MNMKSYYWMVTAMAGLVYLSACAGYRDMVISSEREYPSTAHIGDVQITFPAQSNISFSPMPGASWIMSGDISDIIYEVVAELDAIDFEGLSSPTPATLDIQEIVIEYLDERPDSGSHPAVRLNLELIGRLNNSIVAECHNVTALPAYRPFVRHGLLASRDKMRLMLQPVYEELIKEALTQALVSGLDCLSRHSHVASGG